MSKRCELNVDHSMSSSGHVRRFHTNWSNRSGRWIPPGDSTGCHGNKNRVHFHTSPDRPHPLTCDVCKYGSPGAAFAPPYGTPGPVKAEVSKLACTSTHTLQLVLAHFLQEKSKVRLEQKFGTTADTFVKEYCKGCGFLTWRE